MGYVYQINSVKNATNDWKNQGLLPDRFALWVPLYGANAAGVFFKDRSRPLNQGILLRLSADAAGTDRLSHQPELGRPHVLAYKYATKVKVVRVLGVWIDQRLSFQHHIKVKCAEAKAKLGRLRHLGLARAVITGKKSRCDSVAVAAWKEELESVTAKSALLQVSAMVVKIALKGPLLGSAAGQGTVVGIEQERIPFQNGRTGVAFSPPIGTLTYIQTLRLRLPVQNVFAGDKLRFTSIAVAEDGSELLAVSSDQGGHFVTLDIQQTDGDEYNIATATVYPLVGPDGKKLNVVAPTGTVPPLFDIDGEDLNLPASM
ncbi:hypothetical protein FOZ60_001502, partial [Perkinsus olseni]